MLIRSIAVMLREAALMFPPIRRLHRARDALLVERDSLLVKCNWLSAQFAEASGAVSINSPFFHYNANFDPQEVIRRHAVHDLRPTPGYLTNFLGVRIDPKFFPTILQARAGEVEPLPIPANWHSDIAEWGAALRAVDLATNRFTVIELGCGWGCWINNTGVAARRAGLDVQLIGVEGDADHVRFAHEACTANGFSNREVTLLHGIAAAEAGTALFPRQAQGGVNWGLEPIFGASEAQCRSAVASGQFDVLPMIPLEEVAAAHPRVDLLHIDIQGGEVDLISGCLRVMQRKVAYILIGTHSRQIEGRLMDILLSDGWILEIERPAIFALVEGRPQVTVDGVQGWRNPKLA